MAPQRPVTPPTAFASAPESPFGAPPGTSGDEPTDEPSDATDRTDGRHLRRERNRAAVVDALLGLYREGNLSPSTDEIADRAGLSPRSLFRYFDDVDDLCRVAIQHQARHIVGLIGDPIDTSLPLTERAATFAVQRVRLFDAMSYVGVVARLRAPFQPIIASELTMARSYLRHQLHHDFAPEASALGAEAAATVLAAADVVCSFEAYQLLTTDQSLSPSEAADVFADALVRLLAPSPPATSSPP